MARRPILSKLLHGTLAATVILPTGTTQAAPTDGTELSAYQRLGEDELDQIRGGFVLPNGMDVAVGIEIATLVNGALALRTILIPGSSGTPAVFVGEGGGAAASSQGGVTTLMPDGTSIRVVEGSLTTPAATTGQDQVELVANGPPVSTPLGSVQLEQDDRGATVVLAGNSLELRHMIGRITGTLVANTGNDRVIDTVVTVNVDLRNSPALAGSAMLRVENIMVDAASHGIH